MSLPSIIHLRSCCALEAVPLAPGAWAIGAGAVTLGLQAALALRRARQVLGGGDENTVRLAALSLARTGEVSLVLLPRNLSRCEDQKYKLVHVTGSGTETIKIRST